MHAIGAIWIQVKRWPAWALDAILAVFVAATEVLHAYGEGTPEPAAATVPLLVLTAVPLVLRRRFPLETLAAIGAATLALEFLDVHPALAGLLIALYTVAVRSPRLLSVGAVVVCFAVSAVVVSMRHTPEFIPEVAGMQGFAWALGMVQRTRAAHAAEVERRLELVERQRDERARLAAAEERSRIARELHDVVAHGLSMIVLQAAAARSLLGAEPKRADKPMAEVERVGRESLAEMRRLLGVLDSSEHEAPSLAPQPGLARIDELVERFRQAELPVELKVEGDRRALASGLDLSAFRIVQEALTNVLKHAGRVPVTVTLRYGPRSLDIEVLNQEAAHDHGERLANNNGRGLVGMRERVALLGGEMSVGPDSNGDFRVTCSLPIDEP